MKVYVVECGVYDESYIQGVYASPYAAMNANPVPVRPVVVTAGTHEREGGWRKHESGWSNGLDWSDHASIYEYEVQGADAG